MATRTGDAGANVLEGTALADDMYGLDGNDSLNGLAGNDTLFGGLGQDTLLGGEGNDVLNGGEEVGFAIDPNLSDQLFGGEGNDTLNGFGSNSQLFGGAGDDNLLGGPDGLNDTLDGGTGADDMVGQGGADVYIVDNIGDTVDEYTYDSYGPGNTATGDVDEIRSWIDWTLEQWNNDGFNVENLTLLGNDNIEATGNEVNNVIVGNSGNNIIAGQEQNDTLTGGAGADTFVFSPGGGHDIITDFNVLEDQLSSSGWGATPNVVETADADGFRVFTFNGDTSVTLQGVFANRPPEFTNVPPTTANEDAFFSYTITASDPDGDQLTIVSASYPDWLTVVNGTTLQGVPTQANVGTAGNTFSFVLSDGRGGGAEQAFTLEVLNVNDDPTFETTPDLSGTLGVLYSYTPTFDDEDGDTPMVDVANSVLPGWLTYDPTSGTYSGTPTRSDTGDQEVIIAISDGQGGTATQTFTINVIDVNGAPTSADRTVTTQEDTPALLDLSTGVMDPEGSALTYSVSTEAAHGGVIISNSGVATYTPNLNYFGDDHFEYTVSDPDGAQSTSRVDVTVSFVNDAPEIAPIGTLNASVGAEFIFSLNVTDVDMDLAFIDFDASTLPSWIDPVVASLTLEGTPTQGDVGNQVFTVVVRDTDGASDSETFTFDVISNNQAPIAQDDTVTVTEDTALIISGLSDNDSDPDGDTLTISTVTQGALGGVVNNNDGTVTYTPGSDLNGADAFTYTVSDGNGGTDTATVNVTIDPVNDDPIAQDDVATGTEDTVLVVTDLLDNDSDLELDSLSISAVTQGTHGSVVNNNNGIVNYTPDVDFFGTDSFTYTVSDGNGGTDLATVNVTIGDVNDNPVFTSTPPGQALEDELFTYTFETFDADGDTVTYDPDSSILPDWLTYVGNNTLSGTLTTGNPLDAPTVEVVIAVIDSAGSSATQSFDLMLSGVNDDPTFTSVPDTTAFADQNYEYALILDDEEGDAVTVNLAQSTLPDWLIFDGDKTFSGTPDEADSGIETVVIAIDDGNDGTAEQSFNLNVTFNAPNDDFVPSDVPESVAKVILLYEAALNRDGDYNSFDGLNFWIDNVEGGAEYRVLATAFMNSPEFRFKAGDAFNTSAPNYLSNSEFVNTMYMNVLDRLGEPSGVEYWNTNLDNGGSRSAVLVDFALSPENISNSQEFLDNVYEASDGYWAF